MERYLKTTSMQGSLDKLASSSLKHFDGVFLQGYPVSVERTPACFSAIGHRLA